MRLKKPMVGTTIAGMALVLAACGGSSDENNSSDLSSNANDADKTASKAMDPTATGPLTIEGATAGGNINVISSPGGLTSTLDPRGAYYSDTLSVLTSFLTRSLTQWRYNDSDGTVTLVPDLATDLGQHNDDFTEWTFTLKPDQKYEDGTPIVSEDIAYAVSSSLDCATFADCPSNYLLGTLTGSDAVDNGDDPENPVADKALLAGKKKISGIETPDDSTITFKFDQPFPDLAYYAFFPLFSPIPVDEGKVGDDYGNNLLASGPYKIDAWEPGKSIDLVRNDEWDADSDPGRAALPDTWTFDLAQTDAKTVDQMLLSDDGALSMSYADIDASNIKKFESLGQAVSGPQPLTEWLAPLYDEVPQEVREAMTWAYPYVKAAKTGGALVGTNWVPTTTLIAPGTPGRPTNDDGTDFNPIPDHEAGVTDAAKAKELLTESDNLGFELKWLYQSDVPDSVKVMKVVKAAYEEAGFKATPVATTSANYRADRSNPKTDINVRAGGWLSDWPSGYSWIPPIFNPAEPGTPCADQTWASFGVVNYAKFCEDEVNEKITEVQTMPVEDQPQGWGDLEKFIQTTFYPVIPIDNGGTVQGHGSKVMNHQIDVTGGMPMFKVIWAGQ